jgi:hypothetical protein
MTSESIPLILSAQKIKLASFKLWYQYQGIERRTGTTEGLTSSNEEVYNILQRENSIMTAHNGIKEKHI